MKKIDPKNKTAQLNFRAQGNPPSTLPNTAISNCFPGLEFDFRNLWRRLFVGITLHEANFAVTEVDTSIDSSLAELVGAFLITVDGNPVVGAVTGPAQAGGPNAGLGFTHFEWSNSLADIVGRAGSRVRCSFQVSSGGQTRSVEHDLLVRNLFDPDSAEAGGVAINRELLQPGELTQSLCSPWQNDYKECACYYWAASRPDFVNTEVDAQGKTQGNNWFQKDRNPQTPPGYSLRSGDLVSYEQMFRNWEKELKFIIGGKDEDR
ncbi:MAG: hypothetical protein P9E24_08575 [Candidatus Competibacter sp.]|nr:hypothetical protein [Candidatus Competibacter sp.]